MKIHNKEVVKAIPLGKVFKKLMKKVEKAEAKGKKGIVLRDDEIFKHLYITKIMNLIKKELPIAEGLKYNISALVVCKGTAESFRTYDKVIMKYLQSDKLMNTIEREYSFYDLQYGLAEVEEDEAKGLFEGILYVTEDYVAKEDNAD